MYFRDDTRTITTSVTMNRETHDDTLLMTGGSLPPDFTKPPNGLQDVLILGRKDCPSPEEVVRDIGRSLFLS